VTDEEFNQMQNVVNQGQDDIKDKCNVVFTAACTGVGVVGAVAGGPSQLAPSLAARLPLHIKAIESLVGGVSLTGICRAGVADFCNNTWDLRQRSLGIPGNLINLGSGQVNYPTVVRP
jgi:hypothetical protein